MRVAEKKLDEKIRGFLDRKSKQYPDLHLTAGRPLVTVRNHEQVHMEARPHFFHGHIADVY